MSREMPPPGGQIKELHRRFPNGAAAQMQQSGLNRENVSYYYIQLKKHILDLQTKYIICCAGLFLVQATKPPYIKIKMVLN